MNTKLVKKYYQSSQWLYRLFCYNPRSLGMHHGFWEEGITNRHEALLATNQAVVDLGKISANVLVLDAGCGVGGTAIYIARQTGAQVTGITIDPKQVILATKYAKLHHVENRTSFQTQDYTSTNFREDRFDVVYGIESVCHAHPKSAFLKEAYRVLKPGGKLIVIDGYAAHKPRNHKEREIVNDLCRSFVLEELITTARMSTYLRKAGFVNIRSWSKLKEVAPTIRYHYRLARVLSPLFKLLSLLPSFHLKATHVNAIALLSIGRAYRLGLADYAIHIARKPRTA